MELKTKKHIRIFGAVAGLVMIDQISKIWGLNELKDKNAISVIPDIFELRYLENHGAAFGILQNQQWIFAIITIMALAVLTWIYFKLPENRRYLPLKGCYVFLTAGAIGNFIDRMMNGYVIDFFYFKLIDFPIFNVADIYVTISMVVLIVLLMFYYKDNELDFLSRKGKDGR